MAATSARAFLHQSRDPITSLISAAYRNSVGGVEAQGKTVDSRMAADLAQCIVEYVKESLAVELGLQNERNSPQAVLPDELWCAIWEYLPFFDCVAATHVCGRWRRVALACPTIWQRLTCYSTIHHVDCGCGQCDDSNFCSLCSEENEDYSEDDGHPTGWCNHPYRPGTSNLATVVSLLRRSMDLPLDITLDITPYHSRLDTIPYLPDVLLPNIHRLRELHIRSADATFAGNFLQRFSELPSLRALTVDSLDHDGDFGRSEPSNFLYGNIALPLLERIELGVDCFWPTSLDNLLLPNLHTLSFTPHDTERIAGALRACPRIEHLTLDMGDIPPHSVLDYLLLPVQPVPLISLKIVSDCLAKDQQWFNLSAIRRLVFTYYGWPRSNDPRVEIFQHLTGDVQLVCLLRDDDDDTFVLQGMDEIGRQRRIELLACGDPLVPHYTETFLSRRDYLPAHTVVDILVGVSVWPAFVSAFPYGPRVNSLTVIVDAAVEGSASVTAVGEGGELKAPTQVNFPALKTLRIAAGFGHVSMTAAEIVELVRNLGLRFPVDTLVVDRGLFSGDERPLFEIAGVTDFKVVAGILEGF